MKKSHVEIIVIIGLFIDSKHRKVLEEFFFCIFAKLR